jgi:RNA polymerase sigma-70 factor (ECF subfamily)
MSLPPAASRTASNVDAERCHWFAEEVHPHGPQLKSYLRKTFPAVRDVDDVVQESYLRIWKARAEQPIRSAKGFLFEVARRLAIDFTRHESRSPIDARPGFAELSVIEGGPGIAEAVSTREEIALLARAFDALPARCREVMILRQLEGRSQKEIAVHLGLSEFTVQTQVVQGLRRMRSFFRRHGSATRQSP